MRIFHCDHCYNPVFFENVQCVRCGHPLAYLAELAELSALEPASDGLWRVPESGPDTPLYRLCHNYSQERVCNWAVRAEDEESLCASCRLTRVIPDLSVEGNRESWFALETAKRRLVYSLAGIGLPLVPRSDETPDGLAFEFQADIDGQTPVLTGHAEGVITINLAEADDAERERRRLAMHEPYRTLLGHFRHESGHYYWARLIEKTPLLDEFRERFGDERQDYGESLQRHYEAGPAVNWQDRFVSAYASAHPWEDWAETWAHYLHITDTLETASDCGLALRPNRRELPEVRPEFSLRDVSRTPLGAIVGNWLAVAFVLNNLSRGLGDRDSYPFILTETVIDKLRFVHRACGGAPDGMDPQTPAAD